MKTKSRVVMRADTDGQYYDLEDLEWKYKREIMGPKPGATPADLKPRPYLWEAERP